MLVYLKDGSAQPIIVSAATLEAANADQYFWVSPSHNLANQSQRRRLGRVSLRSVQATSIYVTGMTSVV